MGNGVRFAKKDILKIIDDLVKLELLKVKDSVRVIPKDLHLFLKSTDQSALLTKTFNQSAELAIKSIGEKNNNFFFNSTFCIQKDKLPQLKSELREAILKFVDNSIESSGDGIAHLLLALHI